MPIIRSPSNCRCSLWFRYECGGGRVLSRGRFVSNKLQRQFDGLLMMGIIVPETCWAVSVRQSNKILQLIVASSWVFYLSDWRCTEPQILKKISCFYLGSFFWKVVPLSLRFCEFERQLISLSASFHWGNFPLSPLILQISSPNYAVPIVCFFKATECIFFCLTSTFRFPMWN